MRLNRNMNLNFKRNKKVIIIRFYICSLNKKFREPNGCQKIKFYKGKQIDNK